MAGNQGAAARRERVLERAKVVGDDRAAAEERMSVATLRKWRGDDLPPAEDHVQLESTLATPAVAEPPAAGAPSSTAPTPVEPAESPAPSADAVDPPRPLDDIEEMRRLAKAARTVTANGMRRANELLRAGHASEARAASQAGAPWADRAVQWEMLILQAEERRGHLAVTIAQDQAQIFAGALRELLGALDVPLEGPVAALVRAVMHRAGELSTGAQPAALEPEIVDAARRVVCAALTPIVAEHLEHAASSTRAASAAPAGSEPLEAVEFEPAGSPIAVGDGILRVDGSVSSPEPVSPAPAPSSELDVDEDGLDAEARAVWRGLLRKHARPERAQTAFRHWCEQRERDRARPAGYSARGDKTAMFSHPGLR